MNHVSTNCSCSGISILPVNAAALIEISAQMLNDLKKKAGTHVSVQVRRGPHLAPIDHHHVKRHRSIGGGHEQR